MTKLLEISLPRPHPRQAEIEACTAKRIVIRAGRRGGKTTIAARKAIVAAGAGRRVLYTAPIVEQTDAFWTKCTDWLSAAFLTKLIDKNENPHLSISALAELSQDMTAEDYRQEILGEFVEGEGQVFRVKDSHFWRPNGGHADHPKGTTIDWGQVQDYTSISVGCLQCHKELELIRFRGMSYPDQLQRIKELYQRVGGSIWAEANSMGLPNIQQLQADGVPVMPFDTTLQSKRQIVQGLRLALERDEWQFVEDMVARLELEAYEATTSPRTGQTSYQAAEGAHDDTVISRALLVWADAQGHITLG